MNFFAELKRRKCHPHGRALPELPGAVEIAG
jgi:hypothetical protein